MRCGMKPEEVEGLLKGLPPISPSGELKDKFLDAAGQRLQEPRVPKTRKSGKSDWTRTWGILAMAGSLLVCGTILLTLLLPGATPKPDNKGNPTQDNARVDEKKVDTLIRQLENEKITERDAAAKKLAEMGAAVIPYLEKYMDVSSAEVKGRLRNILRRVQLQSMGRIAYSQMIQTEVGTLPHVYVWEKGASKSLARGHSPAWHPDGESLAYVSGDEENSDIYVMDADGSNSRRITKNKMRDIMPRWSPDGKHIVFVSNRDGNFEIYRIGVDGSNLKRLTRNAVADHSPDWSPGGKHILFVSARDGNDEIYTMESDGSGPRRLTHCPVFDESPRWSPDGKKIAFMSSRTYPEENGVQSSFDVYVMNADGSNPDRLTQGDVSMCPSWTADGSGIVFVVDEQRAKNLWGGISVIWFKGGSEKVGWTSGATYGSINLVSKMGFQVTTIHELYSAPSVFRARR